MNSIIVYPRTEQQRSLLQSLLQELNIRFELSSKQEETQLSEEDFYAKIDRSVEQATAGRTQNLPADKQQDFLGL